MIEADHEMIARRRSAMALLAQFDGETIARHLASIAVPDVETLREPENGLVMLRGRIGGDGAPFNVGEATMSRAAMRLPSGEIGFGYTLGRDREKARLIAVCDAMLQSNAFAEQIEDAVLNPLRTQRDALHARRAAETSATRVDFYTMVRGEV